MDLIKESFQRVKEDVYSLKNELDDIKKELNEIQISILTLIKTISTSNTPQFNQLNFLKQIQQTNRQTETSTPRQTDRQRLQHLDRQTDRDFNTSTDRQTQNPTDNLNYFQNTYSQNTQMPYSTHSPTQNTQNSAIRHINQTERSLSTHNSTDILPFEHLKRQNIPFSIGNRGVSTDRQTDRQTDTSTGNRGVILSKEFRENTQNPNLSSVSSNSTNLPQFSLSSTPKHKEVRTILPTTILLNQLDSLKKEIRLKVKHLTPQEMLVLSSIYQLEDQGYLVDYPLLSSKLSLSQSSIRDYIQRIINKGFSLSKEKVNNKQIILHITDEFRQLVSLDTLIKLREL